MAQPTNLYDTFDTTGIREDLTDVIYNISPEDTPILSAIPRTAAKGTKHEWQLDALAAPAANSVIEGDDATIDAMVATTRAFNFTQIQDKVIALSGTQSSVDAAGRADEMAYQIAKKSKDITEVITHWVNKLPFMRCGIINLGAMKLKNQKQPSKLL